MHVCFFNRSYWPDFGATGQLLTELAEGLARDHGWKVTVVTGYPLRTAMRPPAREHRNGVDIIRAAGTTFEPRRFSGRAVNYLTYFGSALLAGLRVARPDVVVALTDPPIIGLAGLAAARRYRVPFVSLCQDVFPEVAALVEDFQSPRVDAGLAAINRYILRHASAIVALGETMKRRLVEGKGADPAKIQVIHNWADCQAVAPAPRQNAWSDAHGFADKFIALHAGNVGLSQELDMVLDAAARLRDRRDITFVFVGDGVKKAALQQRAADLALANVLFFPHQPKEAMPPWYASSDVSLISLRRGLAGVIVPSKTYSALASGRPCIAAVEADCEVAQIVTDAVCGRVIAPGDASALAEAVADLAGDREGARVMGERARAAALRFDRPKQVAAYDALLRGLVTC